MLDRIRRNHAKLLGGALAALLIASVASAAPRPPAAPDVDSGRTLRQHLTAKLPGCGCESREELLATRDRIAAASDLEAAQALALEDVTLARRALGAARRIAPFSEDLANAHGRLERYEREVRGAESVASVTLRFEDLVQIASAHEIVGVDGDYDGGDSVHGKRFGCALSTGELVAVVLGFILGIIPGIILLLLLC